MSLKYYLIPNLMKSAKSRFVARTLSHRVLDVNKLTQAVLRRGTTLTEADIKAVFSVTFEVIADEISLGNTVNLPIVNIRPGISGYFDHDGDRFDSKRHKVRATVSPGLLLRKKMADARLEKVSKAEKAPCINLYLDLGNEQAEPTLTPGSIGRITGSELKFNPANDFEGIFFIDAMGTETKVSLVETRHNGKLVFQNPATLTPGEYMLEVRRLYGVVNPILRTATYRKPISVVK